MNKNAKIYVAGHRGLAGSAICKALANGGYQHIITRTHAELDLTNQKDVTDFFAAEKPEYVFLAAAKVGGILANNTRPAEFIYENLAIQTNIIHSAWQHGVRRLLFLGSSCIYPKLAPQPLRESCLLTGELEPTNRPYALAKIAGIEMCWSFYRQYGARYLCAMPTNLYGEGDNYHPEHSHVIAALIRKFCEAKQRGDAQVVVWGSGTPRREFMFSGDLANACMHLMNLDESRFDRIIKDDQPPLVNIGIGHDITIRELAQMIAEMVGFKGTITYDITKPDGTPQKLLDVSQITSLGWQASVSLKDGLAIAIADFMKDCSKHMIG